MNHTWILEVLADMQRYARRNDLADLADQLDDTIRAARAGIASDAGRPDAPHAEPRGTDFHAAEDEATARMTGARPH